MIKSINVQTGEVTERDYTAQEILDNAEAYARDHPPPTWASVSTLQDQMFRTENNTLKRFARYMRHQATPGRMPKESPLKFKEITDYYEAIEDANNDYLTPQEAIDALNALEEPTE